jgi:hypothetical protein
MPSLPIQTITVLGLARVLLLSNEASLVRPEQPCVLRGTLRAAGVA